MSAPLLRFRQGTALVRDWVAPGEAIAQWTHFVTSKCNAKCRHCFYPINQRNDELTLDEIDRFLQTVPPIRLLLFSGGEPFLRSDLPQIIRSYHERCGFFTASVPTNGYSADRICAAIERICAISPDLHLGIAVSLDGMKEFHDHVRQVPGLWDNAIRTLRAIVDLTRRYSHLTIGVNTVFMRENQSDIEPLLHYIRDEVRPTFHALSFIRGNPVDGTLMHDLDVERYIKLSRWIDDHYGSDVNWNSGWRGVRARARRMINRQRYEYIARQARGGAFESDCLAGEREYVMTETGNIHGCELINDRLGNVRDAHYDFATIRDSVAADAFVASRRARQCRCTHECNTRTMLLFRRRNAIPLVSAALGITKV
jgi:MoaA/NifB/PqqE/SkfB family radical SAM enzyme